MEVHGKCPDSTGALSGLADARGARPCRPGRQRRDGADTNVGAPLECGHYAHQRTGNPERIASGLWQGNPEGIVSLSPGLRAARYPGCAIPEETLNPERVASPIGRSMLTSMPQSLAKMLVHTVFSMMVNEVKDECGGAQTMQPFPGWPMHPAPTQGSSLATLG